MPDISIESIKKFALESQGIKKILKGGGIAGGAAALTMLTMWILPAFMQTAYGGSILTAVWSVAINTARKYILEYDIDVTRTT